MTASDDKKEMRISAGSESSIGTYDIQKDEKTFGRRKSRIASTIEGGDDLRDVVETLDASDQDLRDAQELASTFTLEETRLMLQEIFLTHKHDPNFPLPVLEKIEGFLARTEIFEHPEDHADEIEELKLEAALITNNSPYAEVRAVVDNTDDPNMPSSTIRAWIIGLFFVIVLAFVNQLFSIRQPAIGIGASVAQILAYPAGKAAEFLPNWGFTLFGVRHSLNPGKFSRKEHMLITIMAAVGSGTPYTDNIIWAQYLPQFFNQKYAGTFAYQICIALATNFIGYGLAGICRKFLVYPTYCVWPASLPTIALNSAFHSQKNEPVQTPWKTTWTISRYKFFLWTFLAMFAYFWLPNYFFQALSFFSWITWIAPNNTNLNAITGFRNGLGVNPLSTFDWNNIGDPLAIPFFTTLNSFIGSFFSMFVIIGLWYSNAYNTGYLPINSNGVFDNMGKRYNVSRAIDSRGLFDAAKYQAYSPAYLAAANLTIYFFFFALYTSTISYAALYHRHEIALGWKSLFTWRKADKPKAPTDVHNRLMSVYSEVPHWWYLICLLGAIIFGCVGIAGWDTHTSVGVIFYGLALCLIFVLPIGIISAMTGLQVTLNVLAEFIGGSIVPGNALAMNYFKSFGYVTVAHAIGFSNDLKLAHYVKIPPKHTFMAQMIATLLNTFICTAVLNFQMNGIEDVCQPEQKNKFTCPGINTFFTASVLWGTIGPKKVFGAGGSYTALLAGFPVGLALPLIPWYAAKKLPKQKWLRYCHPVILISGGLSWAPYNLSYQIPSIPIGWYSMVFLKRRYLAFWSKYNYILSASFGSAIAIAGVVIFFALQYKEVNISWWGNDIVSAGCEGTPCTRLTLPKGEYFGPRIGQFH